MVVATHRRVFDTILLFIYSRMKEYTLSELSALIGESIAIELPETYWVRAEIASLSEKGGHLYLELIEKGTHEILVAKQRATCWSNLQTMLQAYFEQETGSRLQAGMQVLVETEVNYHAVYGLSLNIINIDPRYTLGDMARQRQETIRRLQEEGIIDMQKELLLPTLTRRIAVVSAESAAGYGDFCDQLYASPYPFSTQLFAATMQGDNAERSIIAALGAIAVQEEDFDAVVIIRGGGASTDLSCFDRYNLCAHCAQFPLPVISGIGHTRDVSVLDMVAHSALKTPTAVAAYLIERMDSQSARIDDLRQRLLRTADRQILMRQHRIDEWQQRLEQANRQQFLCQLHKLELFEQRITACSPERIYRMGYSLLKCNGKAVRSIRDVAAGDVLTTYMQDGKIESIAQ